MNDSSDGSTFRALHRLVEHYTPDGTLGRTLLGGPALLFAPFLLLGGMAMMLGLSSLVTVLTGLLGVLVGTPAFFVGIIALWPVYLSLIGNVESAAAYPAGAGESPTDPERATEPQADRESAEAVLKRRYAAGELSREEFERRLDDVMATGGSRRERSAAGNRGSNSDGDDEQTRLERSSSR